MKEIVNNIYEKSEHSLNYVIIGSEYAICSDAHVYEILIGYDDDELGYISQTEHTSVYKVDDKMTLKYVYDIDEANADWIIDNEQICALHELDKSSENGISYSIRKPFSDVDIYISEIEYPEYLPVYAFFTDIADAREWISKHINK